MTARAKAIEAMANELCPTGRTERDGKYRVAGDLLDALRALPPDVRAAAVGLDAQSFVDCRRLTPHSCCVAGDEAECAATVRIVDAKED